MGRNILQVGNTGLTKMCDMRETGTQRFLWRTLMSSTELERRTKWGCWTSSCNYENVVTIRISLMVLSRVSSLAYLISLIVLNHVSILASLILLLVPSQVSILRSVWWCWARLLYLLHFLDGADCWDRLAFGVFYLLGVVLCDLCQFYCADPDWTFSLFHSKPD